MSAAPPRKPPPPAGPAPDERRLREAALAHLARFAATEAGLRQVLHRRIDRWARRAESEGAPGEAIAGAAAMAKRAATEVARKMVVAGAVDDAGFAASRARRLARAGRSRRAIAAHLAGKGVAAAVRAAALPEDAEADFLAALAYCRRRRSGPFATVEAAQELRLKWLGALARAGFGRDVAERALDEPPDTAAERLLVARTGAS